MSTTSASTTFSHAAIVCSGILAGVALSWTVQALSTGNLVAAAWPALAAVSLAAVHAGSVVELLARADRTGLNNNVGTAVVDALGEPDAPAEIMFLARWGAHDDGRRVVLEQFTECQCQCDWDAGEQCDICVDADAEQTGDN